MAEDFLSAKVISHVAVVCFACHIISEGMTRDGTWGISPL